MHSQTHTHSNMHKNTHLNSHTHVRIHTYHSITHMHEHKFTLDLLNHTYTHIHTVIPQHRNRATLNWGNSVQWIILSPPHCSKVPTSASLRPLDPLWPVSPGTFRLSSPLSGLSHSPSSCDSNTQDAPSWGFCIFPSVCQEHPPLGLLWFTLLLQSLLKQHLIRVVRLETLKKTTLFSLHLPLSPYPSLFLTIAFITLRCVYLHDGLLCIHCNCLQCNLHEETSFVSPIISLTSRMMFDTLTSTLEIIVKLRNK